MNAQCGRTWSITVPADARGVPRVRGAVCDTLRAWGTVDEHAVQTVRLIVSELLTNVVLHASAATAEAVVTIELLDDFRMRLGVHDSHPGSPAAVQSDVGSLHGRGLSIAQALVQELDGHLFVERAVDGGKTVGIVVAASSGSPAAGQDGGSAGAQAEREGEEPCLHRFEREIEWAYQNDQLIRLRAVSCLRRGTAPRRRDGWRRRGCRVDRRPTAPTALHGWLAWTRCSAPGEHGGDRGRHTGGLAPHGPLSVSCTQPSCRGGLAGRGPHQGCGRETGWPHGCTRHRQRRGLHVQHA